MAGIIEADLRWVILWGAIAGLPAIAVGGVLFGRYIAGRIHVDVPEYIVRISLGSATVTMVTAAAIVAPAIEGAGYSAPLIGAIVIASGATTFSHVNDSGFWLVNRYLGISEKHTLQTWTVMVTIVGLIGFMTVLAISIFL